MSNCAEFGPGPGTLQDALATGGSIAFACSGTIVMPEVTITANTAIDGIGHTVVLSGGGANRLFTVTAGSVLTLRRISLYNGHAGSAFGGAVFNDGGTLNISQSALTYNQARFGGAVANVGGTTTIANTTIAMNHTNGLGGGGGIVNSGGTTIVTNATIALNNGYGGGGVNNLAGTITFRNSIVAQNGWKGNCVNSGTFNGTLSNRDDDDTCPGFADGSGGQLRLGPLQGTPAYIPLLPGSIAIDRGNNALCIADPVNAVDQGGVTRPVAANPRATTPICDIGAIEFVWDPPDVPLCFDFDDSANTSVLADFPPDSYGIHCRILVQDGLYREDRGGIGNLSVLSETVYQAVDIYSLHGLSAAGSKVCLYGPGGLLFLDAEGQPRAPQILPATNEKGYSCAIIPNVGTLVLVGDTTGYPSSVSLPFTQGLGDPAAPPPPPAIIPLSGCRVTTTAMLNLRAEPSLDAEIITILPFEFTLTATAKTAGWYQVDYRSRLAWVSADWVNTRGKCR